MLVHFQALLSVAPNYDSYDPTLVSLFTLSWPATPDLTSVFEGHLLIEFLWLSPQFLRLGLLIELPILSTILGILTIPNTSTILVLVILLIVVLLDLLQGSPSLI